MISIFTRVVYPATVRYSRGDAIAAGTASMAQYCISKLCNLFCAYEMDRLIHEHTEKRITVNAFNPGAMSDTGFAAPTGNALTRVIVRVIGGIMGALIGKQSAATDSGKTLSPAPRGVPLLVGCPERRGRSVPTNDRGAPTARATLPRGRRTAVSRKLASV